MQYREIKHGAFAAQAFIDFQRLISIGWRTNHIDLAIIKFRHKVRDIGDYRLSTDTLHHNFLCIVIAQYRKFLAGSFFNRINILVTDKNKGRT